VFHGRGSQRRRRGRRERPRARHGLTVAGASIIPIGLSAFTHIPAIMIAERLAEEIGSSR
jgi:choline dehydrogenase-like flavoprotein